MAFVKPIKIAAEEVTALGEIGGDRGAQLNLAAGLNGEAAAARQGDRMVKQLLDVIGGDGMLVVAHGCDQPLELRADPVRWAVLEADASDMAMHGLEVTESTCRHPAHPRFCVRRIRSRRLGVRTLRYCRSSPRCRRSGSISPGRDRRFRPGPAATPPALLRPASRRPDLPEPDCPQQITRRYTAGDLAPFSEPLWRRIRDRTQEPASVYTLRRSRRVRDTFLTVECQGGPH